jgi:hypothetical protein
VGKQGVHILAREKEHGAIAFHRERGKRHKHGQEDKRKQEFRPAVYVTFPTRSHHDLNLRLLVREDVGDSAVSRID